MMTSKLPWRDAHRIRLHHFANNQSHDLFSFLVPDLWHDEADSTSPRPPGLKTTQLPAHEAMDFFFDMKLAGVPLQCSEDDGTCNDMQ